MLGFTAIMSGGGKIERNVYAIQTGGGKIERSVYTIQTGGDEIVSDFYEIKFAFFEIRLNGGRLQ